MHTVLQLLKWLLRAWPVIVMLIVICVHCMLIFYFSLCSSEVNKVASLLTQLVGGGFILYSIDSNIRTFNEKNIVAIFKDYLREFPLIKRPVIAHAKVSPIKLKGANGTTTVTENPKSIDEKLEYLQRQINNLYSKVEYNLNEITAKIDSHINETKSQINDTKLDVKNIESKIKEASIGGIKSQLFGVLLMVYGAFCGYFA